MTALATTAGLAGDTAPGGPGAGAPAPDRRLRWRSLVSRVGFVLPALVILVALLWALFPGLFTAQNPTATVAPALQAPSAEHWFGTDATGRDLYARVVYGASQSIIGALVAVVVGLVVGTAIGLAAGALGGRHRRGCSCVSSTCSSRSPRCCSR